MPSFSFNSEDVVKANEKREKAAAAINNKKKMGEQPDKAKIEYVEKIFSEVGDFRSAKGLETDKKIDDLFISDNKRNAAIVFKKSDGKTEVLIGPEINTDDKDLAKSIINPKIEEFQMQYGLSPQQVKDFKILSSQGTNIAGNILPYVISKFGSDLAQNIVNHDDGTPTQFEINKDGNLICRTFAKIILDKERMEGFNLNDYSRGTANDIKSKDYMIIISEVNLGPPGETNFKPITVCNLSAKGKIANKLLNYMKQDIPTSEPQKDSKTIKREFNLLHEETLNAVEGNEYHEQLVKKDIKMLLSNKEGEIEGNIKTLQKLKTTPKLFAEVIIDQVNEIQQISNIEERTKVYKALNNNAAKLLDQPKFYTKVLVNDVIRRLAADGTKIEKSKSQKITDIVKLLAAKLIGDSKEITQTKDLVTKKIEQYKSTKPTLAR